MITHKEFVTVEDEELQKEIQEECANRIEHRVAFSWEDFTEDANLSTVPVQLNSEAKKKPRKGTKLIITSLRDISVWERDTTKNNLINQISQLIFPFKEVKPFRVYLIINGEEIKLNSISEKMRDLGVSRFTLGFDGEKLSLTGKIRLNRLQGAGTGKEGEIYERYISPDQGKDFYTFLTSPSNNHSIDNVSYIGKDGWFLHFSEEVSLASLGDLSLITVNGKTAIANPGSFHAEIDEFFLRNVDTGNVFGRFDEYRQFVSRHAGIRIFRDGFGVRPYGLDGQDWLNLSGGQTSGLSYYLPRPNNLIGFVEISALINKELQDKTDREGLVVSPYSRNFFLILAHFIKLLEKFFNNYGRSLNEFRKLRADDLSSFTTTEAQIEEIKRVSVNALQVEEKVEILGKGLEGITDSIEDAFDKTSNAPIFASQQELEFQGILGKTREKLHEAQDLIDNLRQLLEQTKRLGYIADSLEPKVKILEDQLAQFSELASLGLIAEALSHETNTIADRLAEQTKSINTKLKSQGIFDAELITYIEYVKSAISSLRKQLNHLSPSLRYLRETTEVISIKEFFADLRNFYMEGRFRDSEIKVILEEPFEDFQVKINRGKITQIFDNLFLNSEYWLEQFVDRQIIRNPEINIRSKKPFIYMSDNGLGIDPSIDTSIFQPFVTTKPKNIGRGLGLFITRELLDSSNCTIDLLLERNSFNRRYIFRINLTGVLNG